MIYHFGMGNIQTDIAKAIVYYEQAAALGHTTAMNNLGVIYQYGNKVHGFSEKEKLYTKEIRRKCADIVTKCFALQDQFDGNTNGPDHSLKERNPKTEIEEHSKVGLLHNLGARFQHGTGAFALNLDKAVEYYERAAALGDIEAQHNLDTIYQNRANSIVADTENLFRYLEAAASDGSAYAHYILKFMISLNNDNAGKKSRKNVETLQSTECQEQIHYNNNANLQLPCEDEDDRSITIWDKDGDVQVNLTKAKAYYDMAAARGSIVGLHNNMIMEMMMPTDLEKVLKICKHGLDSVDILSLSPQEVWYYQMPICIYQPHVR